ncbi:hypothetical protein OEB96_46210 [Paraliomyxa miuraensis]|nr:hypothetical protein [Paraliomyxa miuraensis]
MAAILCLALGACGTDGREDGEDSAGDLPPLTWPSTDSASDSGMATTSDTSVGSNSQGSGTAPTTESTVDPDESGDPPKFDTATQPDGGNGGQCDCGGDVGWSYIWVSNSNESTVSKINTQTLVEEGRYYTEPNPANGNPSRTSVSLSADAVAVANRNGGVTKVWARSEFCDPLRNGMPGVQTSMNSTPMQFAADDCIAWHADYPYTTQRPVAWTSGVQNQATCMYEDAAVWTSGCSPGADANVWVHLLDGDTGISLMDVNVPGFVCSGFGAYGGAVDSNNDFWISSNSSSSQIARIRLSDGSTEVINAPHWAYGIAVDSLDRVWLTANQAQTGDQAAQRYDPATGTWDVAMLAGGGVHGYSGIQEGTDGRMWLNYGYGGAIGLRWIDRDTLMVGPGIPVPGAVSWLNGISIDPDGNVWTVSPGANSVFRYDPVTATFASVGGLNNPYTYSDMTGSGLLNATCGSPVG